jgi:hypothetical protein
VINLRVVVITTSDNPTIDDTIRDDPTHDERPYDA